MKRILLAGCLGVIVVASSALAGRNVGRSIPNAAPVRSTINRGGAGTTRNAVIGRNWNQSRNWNTARNWNGNWRRPGHTRVVFIGGFGYPFYGYPYNYYPYAYSSYPYDYNYYDRTQPVYDGNSYRSGGGSVVVQVQQRLARDGYYKGAIDGVMGSRTYYAIRSYERSHGLRVDGEIDDELLGTMGLR